MTLTESHGVKIDEFEDLNGVRKGSFGTTFFNCQAWACGGDGFRSTKRANPHGTHYLSCRSTACKGVGFRLRGSLARILGGDAQLNHDWGIEARGGKAITVTNTYVEGNSRSNEFPVELYARNTPGLTIQDCYFHGITPRSTPGHDYQHVQGTFEGDVGYHVGPDHEGPAYWRNDQWHVANTTTL